VIVRPVLRLVVKLRDIVDFVFGFDVTVLGAADVDADAVLRLGLKIDPGIGDRLSGAVNGDTASPGTHADLLLLLVLEWVVLAHAGQLRAHVADIDALDAGHAGEQVLPELRQRIAVGRG
jgi:hypothetical protein